MKETLPRPIPTPNLSGHAFALQEYYAPCYPSNGSLLLIISRLSQNAKNIFRENDDVNVDVDGFPSSSYTLEHSVPVEGSNNEQMVVAPGLEWENKNEKEREDEGRRSRWKWKQSGRATFMVQELPLSPSPVSRPRVALIGNLTLISNVWSASGDIDVTLQERNWPAANDDELEELEKCYLAYHPDSKWWLPGKSTFHVSFALFPSFSFFLDLKISHSHSF